MGRKGSRESVKRGAITFLNGTDKPVLLVLEPWGDAHPIPPRGKGIVTYDGPVEGDLEVEIAAAGRVNFYGWTGSVLDVRHDGEKNCDQHARPERDHARRVK